MIYIMPYDIYLCAKHTDRFNYIYGNTYNTYVVHQVKPSIILKDMLICLDSPRDMYETLTFFEIEYTHNYLEFLLHNLMPNTNSDEKAVNYSNDNILLDIEVK